MAPSEERIPNRFLNCERVELRETLILRVIVLADYDPEIDTLL